MFSVIATIDPSSPAAYCRKYCMPFSGGGPGLYEDFSMFCFHVPIKGLNDWDGACPESAIEAKITTRPPDTIKLRFMRTSRERQFVLSSSDRIGVQERFHFFLHPGFRA